MLVRQSFIDDFLLNQPDLGIFDGGCHASLYRIFNVPHVSENTEMDRLNFNCMTAPHAPSIGRLNAATTQMENVIFSFIESIA